MNLGVNAITATYFIIWSWHVKVSCQVDPQLLLLLKQYKTKFEQFKCTTRENTTWLSKFGAVAMLRGMIVLWLF